MIIALLIAGILFFLAGALGIFLGIPVKEFSFGNTLILAGVVAGCTGMLTLGLAAVIRELKQIAERLESGAVAAAPSPQPAAAVAPRSQPVENPAAFLVRAAMNIRVDNYRHEQLSGGIAADLTHENYGRAPLQDEVMEARARLARVRKGLEQLSPRTREVFLLHRLDNLKYREIAERLGISQSAVEKHIAKAILFLTEYAEGW